MTRSVTLRLEDHLLDALKEAAEEEDRSLNNYVARLLTEATRLREGHSTLGASPKIRDVPLPGTGYPPAKKVSKRPTSHERTEAARRLPSTFG